MLLRGFGIVRMMYQGRDILKYDFDKITDRRKSDSSKWNVAEGELPMWVADMDFQTAPEIIHAMQKRLDHGFFGYSDLTDEWYDAYISWWKKRHDFEIKKDWLIFSTGVIPSISSLVRKLTTPNENVLLLTPVYNIFYNSTLNNGCRVSECPLVYDRETSGYGIDFERLEAGLADPQTSLMILCNPHNPVGKIWDRDTLARIGELAEKYSVTVISDEIHCDLTEPGKNYVPFASVSESAKNNSITCIAPTKTFNIAGLQTSAVFVPDPVLRHKAWRALNTDEVAEPNSFAQTAAIAAFNEGGLWLDCLREYLWENRRTAEQYIADNVPELKSVSSDATYLMWIDISKTGMAGKAFAAGLREKTGLYLSAGNSYGKGGEGFVRLNLACPRSVLSDGLLRLGKYVETLS